MALILVEPRKAAEAVAAASTMVLMFDLVDDLAGEGCLYRVNRT